MQHWLRSIRDSGPAIATLAMGALMAAGLLGCATTLQIEEERLDRLPSGTAEVALARAYVRFLGGSSPGTSEVETAELVWLEIHPWDTHESLADARRDLDFVVACVNSAVVSDMESTLPRVAVLEARLESLRAQAAGRYAESSNRRVLAAVQGEPRAAHESRGYWQAQLQSRDAAIRELAAERLERLDRTAAADDAALGLPSVYVAPSTSAPLLRELAAKSSASVVSVVVEDATGIELGQGSGVVVGNSHTVVTNLHVVENASAARIRTSTGADVVVRTIAAIDAKNDLALLHVPNLNLPPMQLHAGEAIRVGDRVLALGAPRGLVGTVSDGIVSAYRQLPDVEVPVIQTTAPISEGSSGGALVSFDGRLVGVTTLIMDRGQNLNFAVPADRVDLLLAKSRRRNSKAERWPGKPLAELPVDRLVEASQRALERGDIDAASQICEAGVKGHPKAPTLWICTLVTRAARCDRDGAYLALEEVKRLDERAHLAGKQVLGDADADHMWRRCRK